MPIFRWLKNLFKPTRGPSYLIEFRFTGYAKKYLKKEIRDVSKKFRVKGVTKKKVVPHISLIGPFKTKKPQKVVSKFLEVSKKYEWMKFRLHGFGYFDDRVIYADVKPRDRLIQYRKELFQEIEPLIYTVDTDYLNPFEFHATIAFKDIQGKFRKIWNYLDRKKPKRIEQTLIRATLLRGPKIMHEYDFIQGRMLNRKQALDRRIKRKTMGMLKKGGKGH